MEELDFTPNESLRRIVCAANLYLPERKHIPKVMLLGPRHWDETMRKQYEQMKCDVRHDLFEQGFIDNFGTFWNRTGALIIARRMNQVVRELDYDTHKLYSEMLY
jgi:hypothetical protein